MNEVNKEIDKQYKRALDRFACLPAYHFRNDKIRKNKAYSFIESNQKNKVAFILLVKHAFSFKNFELCSKKVFIETFSKEYRKYSLK